MRMQTVVLYISRVALVLLPVLLLPVPLAAAEIGETAWMHGPQEDPFHGRHKYIAAIGKGARMLAFYCETTEGTQHLMFKTGERVTKDIRKGLRAMPAKILIVVDDQAVREIRADLVEIDKQMAAQNGSVDVRQIAAAIAGAKRRIAVALELSPLFFNAGGTHYKTEFSAAGSAPAMQALANRCRTGGRQ